MTVHDPDAMDRAATMFFDQIGNRPHTTTMPEAEGHEMSELRDEIIRQVERAHSFEGDEWDYIGSDDVADAILALVHDALMSDEALRAGSTEIFPTWVMPDNADIHQEALQEMRDGINAALDAAGITKGEGNE